MNATPANADVVVREASSSTSAVRVPRCLMPAFAPASNEPDVGDVVVTVADVLAAQARLRRYLRPTPMHHAERFGVMAEAGKPAAHRLVQGARRTECAGCWPRASAAIAAPVIAASAGNHAQGLAWAAYRLGMQAITVMPHGAPATKIAGVAHWGATVRLHGDSYDEAKAFAAELAAQNGYRCCPPSTIRT
jgi:threonine dehydratase